jgi:hypothetical protein
MRKFRRPALLLLLPMVFLGILLMCPSAFAQCAMCRASLGGSNNAFFIRNFNIGVLVLLTPPVAIFCSIFLVLKRHGAAPTEGAKPDGSESESEG